MQSSSSNSTGRKQRTTPPLDSSSEDLDEIELCIDSEFGDLDDISDEPRKPHFLDYDYNLSLQQQQQQHHQISDNLGEQIKVDKSLERDGEISDHELASNYSNKHYKKELNINSNRTTGESSGTYSGRINTKVKKHFLDENPIPPTEYEQSRIREHRSLDRSYDRTKQLTNERKHSLDRDLKKTKSKDNSSSYTLSRFIEQEIPMRGTWPTEKPNDYRNSQGAGMAADLGPKVECVYSLLSMLGSHDAVEMSSKFLELSKNRETCAALRRSGCIPLLVQIIHSDPDEDARKRAGMALHNVILSHPDDKAGRREARVLRLIEQLIDYSDSLRNISNNRESCADDTDRHPIQAIGTLMKISFDEDHRHAMCQLGALQTISNLVQWDHQVHSPQSEDFNCITLRRYAGMTLTNLTFGDGNNKALLCSNIGFMRALVSQIESNSDELVQVTASVLRNLSWRADANMKHVLNEIGTVRILTKSAMACNMENTLKAILSALWNLSNHCPTNKAEFCEVEGSIEFLIDMLTYDAPSKTMAVIENAGGILRNVSSYIATKEELRHNLRQRNCLSILLQQLKSPSLTIVSNACGTLGNLSANSPEDQKYLRDNGAIPMLRSLIYSKHKMISSGSTTALKHLLNYKSNLSGPNNLDSVTKLMDLKELPTLNVRKQRALEQELDQNLLCSDEIQSMKQNEKSDARLNRLTRSAIEKSCSRESIQSSKSEPFKECSTSTASSRDTFASDATMIKKEEYIESKFSPETDDKPINYSRQYNQGPNSDYQETDLDQITDYSIRYAENQSDSEDDKQNVEYENQNNILIPEDSIKCYYTEGTPRMISNATSMNDLRIAQQKEKAVAKKQDLKKENCVNFNSGIHSPEKPVNYCEEGTPGGFSRNDSLSSLEDHGGESTKKTTRPIRSNPVPCQTPPVEEKKNIPSTGGATPNSSVPKSVTFVDLAAEETPLMFSRTSSMGSLSSAEPAIICDDRSSIVSEFSRIASGIISPSELPDSPTQTIPQTTAHCRDMDMNPSASKLMPQNLDATFSTCPTSLSNLSLDDEDKIVSDCLTKDMRLMNHPSEDHDDVIDENDEKNVNVHENDNLSDDEGSDNDNILLESCINIGMRSASNRVENNSDNFDAAQRSATANISPTNKDVECYAVQQYATEDTPATFSKVGSETNLSILSIESTKDGTMLTDDSSNGSDIGNDRLLEECIRDGLPKPSNTKHGYGQHEQALPATSYKLPQAMYKENPIKMMRSGSSGLTPYTPSNDEMNKFMVEDSPCSFSVTSGLSDITVNSGVAGLAKIKRSPPKNRQVENRNCDDSLSSLSIESEDDSNLLNQAIAAGFNAKPKKTNQIPNMPMPGQHSSHSQYSTQYYNMNDRANDSFSSIESSDSNENQNNSLLEQCIRSGMNKGTNNTTKVKPRHETSAAAAASIQSRIHHSPNKSPKHAERDRQKERERKDEQLLLECINTGIARTTTAAPPSSVAMSSQQMQINARQFRQDLSMTNDRMAAMNIEGSRPRSSSNSKNMETTSVGVPDTSATSTVIPLDVERVLQNTNKIGTDELKGAHYLGMNHQIGYDQSNNYNVLERSNEYPAFKVNHLEDSMNDLLTASTNMDIMDMSNEFLIDNTTSEISNISYNKSDKHKDPDLMMKSVERLTQELVSTAEYLRTTNNSSIETSFEIKRSSNNDTWNDNTCPNDDVSFPSISMTAPVIADDDDTTISSNKIDKLMKSSGKFNYCKDNDETPTNETKTFTPGNEINFKVGGEVKHLLSNNAEAGSLPYQSYSLDTMSRSTIITNEAKKIVKNFEQNCISDSMTSLMDLDNIRPPSAMDNVSMSSVLLSPQFSNKLNNNTARQKKSLLPGLMAKRALNGGHFNMNNSASNLTSNVNNSMDSINNLDNINPPSIMDDLMDSMISVDSIQSEIVENNNLDTTNYETALSDLDDDTITLRSCQDDLLPYDTTTQSDFSSCNNSLETTPKKYSRSNSKKLLTPKQKRQIIKDRYRTYTIAADMVLHDLSNDIENQSTEAVVEEPKFVPTEQSSSTTTSYKNANIYQTYSRRQSNSDRYKTRTISEEEQLEIQRLMNSTNAANNQAEMLLDDDSIIDNITMGETDLTEDSMSSIRVLKERFKFINSPTATTPTAPPTRNDNFIDIKAFINYDYDEQMQQNSETESCNQNVSNSEDEIQATKLTKPRIIIPETASSASNKDTSLDSNMSDGSGCCSSSPEPKGIRGRKKAPYISPYRKSVTPMSVANPSKLMNSRKPPVTVAATGSAVANNTVKPLAVKSIQRNQTVVSRTHVLVNKTNMSNKLNASKSGILKPTYTSNTKIATNKLPVTPPAPAKVDNSKKGKISLVKKSAPSPARPPKVISPVATLNRQSTFIKDEPSHPDVPIVISEPTSPMRSRIPSKIGSSPSKIGVPKTALAKSASSTIPLKTTRIPLQKSASLEAAKVLPKTALAPVSRRYDSALLAQRSNSNVSLTSPAPVALTPGRSKSNISSITPPSGSATGPSAIASPPANANVPKKDITSKIAGLWKKIDESKKQQQLNLGKKDSRVWISRSNSNTENAAKATKVNGHSAEAQLLSPSSPSKRLPCLNNFVNADGQDEVY